MTSAGVLNAVLTSQYVIEITVSDGTSSDSQNVTVDVIDVPEAPVIYDMPAVAVIKENDAGVIVYTVNASDRDGDSIIFSSVTDPVGVAINITETCKYCQLRI